jgi:formiminotetrahydrofolate cyclodeaminase
LEDQENFRKIPENYILPKDSGSQKEESRGARG